MRLRGKLTQQELKDVRSLVISKSYWPKLILRSWYGILLLCAVTTATVRGLMSHAAVNWRGLGILWLVIAAIIVYTVLGTRRSTREEFAAMNAALPDRIELEPTAVRLKSDNGRIATLPWSTFRDWRGRGNVILLDNLVDEGFVMLPLSDLPTAERELLRGILASHLGAATKG